MPFASRDDVRVHYVQEGSGDPPLVFIHGWCCDHSFFEPQFDHFKTGHTVLAMDLRGCGESDRPEEGYDIPTLADDVAWLCGELRLTRAVLAGHSLGGMIALELAARYPKLAAAVVAVDPGPIHPTPEALRVFEGFLEQLQGPEAEAVRRAWIEADFLPGDDPDRKRRIVETMCSVPLDVAAAVIRGLTTWNGVGALALCGAPVLVVLSKPGGSNDPSRLSGLKPEASFGMTVGSGHFLQLEVPEQVTPMIERFLRVRLPAAR